MIDIIPFGDISGEDEKIIWPPKNEVIMSVIGFNEVYATSLFRGPVYFFYLFLDYLQRMLLQLKSTIMEIIKNFFTKDNISSLFEQFYKWLEGILADVFGNFTYEPLRDLLIIPWFWIIIFALVILGLIFRKR